MALGLLNKVLKFLQQNPEQEFTAREIADWIFATYPDDCREKQARSDVIDNETALLEQIIREIGPLRPRLQKKYPGVKTTEGPPRRYYFTESTDSAEINQAEISEASPALKELDLYPILSAYLWSDPDLKIYSKRINEKTSSNSQGPSGNKWLHPDLVGMEVLISDDWHDDIQDCVQSHAGKKVKLWSFEVKRKINRSNVRDAFFQAVGNSSWANFGYLVASELATDTLKELRMLASLHGIGFIQLNAKDASESQIRIPAEERSEIDWDTANRLIVNTDFRKYINLIRRFCHDGKLSPADWDISTDGN